jgi:hypothetical protein
MRRFGYVSCAIVFGFLACSSMYAQNNSVNVVTWHNDNLRTGQNTAETVLTNTNLRTGNFGELCSANLNGQVYAQPLVLSNVTFNGTQYASLVYVVTHMNMLYVINGTPPASGLPCTVVASLSLNPPNQYPTDCTYIELSNCMTIWPVVGILGTPVIQMVPNSNGTLYLVTETQNTPVGTMPTNWYHYLHAVNLDQLVELTPPIPVFPPIPATNPTQASYWSRHHIQRPGLLLAGNYLYIAFSMMDGNLPLPNGSVFGYDVTNLSAPPLYFPLTPDNALKGGGIWQGGSGLAYGPDETGTNYIYFNTGNGVYDGSKNWSDSFIKLNPVVPFAPAASFTPADQAYRACTSPIYTDIDFGSGGVMLTPSSSNWQFMAVSGDKEGGIWVMDRQSPGGFNLGECPSGCNACSTSLQLNSNLNLETVWLGKGSGPAIHNTPAYWNNYVYISPVNSPISQYQVCNNSPTGPPLCGNPVNATGPFGATIITRYGTTPSVSASSDSTSGILWVLEGVGSARSTQPGHLYAFDATTMTSLYANTGGGSPCPQVDAIAPAIKYSVPTIANGYVYLSTQAVQNGVNTGGGTFYIFGLNRQCTAAAKPPSPR